MSARGAVVACCAALTWLTPSSATAAPAPGVLVVSDVSAGPVASRILGECAAAGLRTMAVIDDRAVAGPSPAALMARHGAHAVVMVSGEGTTARTWWRDDRGRLISSPVRRRPGDGERGLAIRIAERLRAAILPLAEAPATPPEPMPLPAALPPTSPAPPAPALSRPPTPISAPPTTRSPSKPAPSRSPAVIGRQARYRHLALRLGLANNDATANHVGSTNLALSLARQWAPWLESELRLILPGLPSGKGQVFLDGGTMDVRYWSVYASANWTPDSWFGDLLWPSLGVDLGMAAISLTPRDPDASSVTQPTGGHGSGGGRGGDGGRGPGAGEVGSQERLVFLPGVHAGLGLRVTSWLQVRVELHVASPLPQPRVAEFDYRLPVWDDPIVLQTLSVEVAL